MDLIFYFASFYQEPYSSLQTFAIYKKIQKTNKQLGSLTQCRTVIHRYAFNLLNLGSAFSTFKHIQLLFSKFKLSIYLQAPIQKQWNVDDIRGCFLRQQIFVYEAHQFKRCNSTVSGTTCDTKSIQIHKCDKYMQQVTSHKTKGPAAQELKFDLQLKQPLLNNY